MVVVIISWIYYFVLCMGIGMGIEKALEKAFAKKWQFRTIDYLMTGIVGITIYAAFFSIFYKLSMAAHVSLLCLWGICVYATRGGWGRYLKKRRQSISFWEGFFYVCFILLIAFFTSRGTFHTDTNIYHAQNIRIYEEYGLIKGMANLQLHYGYNSLYLAFTAILSLRWLLPWSLHTTTGFIEMILCLYALHHLKSFKERKNHLEDAGCVGILFYTLVNVTGSMSPATDYPTMFLTIYMICAWLRAIHDKEDYMVYGLLAVFGVFLGVMKVSAITMVLVVVYPAYYLLKEKKWKEIFVFISLGIIIILPFLIRNYLISGWLVYPFEALDLFQVPWKVPVEDLRVDAAQIKVWGRCLYDIGLLELPLREWLPIWWESQERYAIMMFGGNVLGIVLALFNLAYKIIKKIRISGELVVLYLAIVVSVIFWFFMAPFIRYGLAFLLCLPLIGMASWYDYEKKGFQSIATGCLVFGIFLCFSPYADNYVTDAGVFIKQRIKEPYYVSAKDYDYGKTDSIEINGEVIYYNDYDKEEGERNSYHYFPNTAYKGMLDKATLAGENIKDGFVPRK